MKALSIVTAIVLVLAGLWGAARLWNTPTAGPAAETGHEHGADEDEHEEAKGPHGGRMLNKDGFGIEMTIFEAGVAPELLVYTYAGEKPVAPGEVQLTVLLHRLGGRTDTLTFTPEGEFLKSDQSVEEPHSFDVEVKADFSGKAFSWTYGSYEGRVQISPDSARQGGLETATAGPASLRGSVTLPGEIKLNANQIVHVVPRLSGLVREVKKNLGETVKKGELLAIIDSRELADAKSGLLADLERRELAQVRATREKELFTKKISSEEEYLTAKQALAELDVSVRAADQKLQALGLSEQQIRDIRSGKDVTLTDYPIYAPIDGTVIEKHLSTGEAVADDADAFVIADLTSVWAEVVVYAADLGRIRENNPVTVHSKDLGIQAEGVIAFIGALVGEQTRTATAIVNLPNPEGKWRPGLFVTVNLADEAFEVPVAVPSQALQSFRDGSVVFVNVGDTYEARPVETGRSDGENVEIVNGLMPGEIFVSKNSYLIKADIEKAGAAHEH